MTLQCRNVQLYTYFMKVLFDSHLFLSLSTTQHTAGRITLRHKTINT